AAHSSAVSHESDSGDSSDTGRDSLSFGGRGESREPEGFVEGVRAREVGPASSDVSPVSFDASDASHEPEGFGPRTHEDEHESIAFRGSDDSRDSGEFGAGDVDTREDDRDPLDADESRDGVTAENAGAHDVSEAEDAASRGFDESRESETTSSGRDVESFGGEYFADSADRSEHRLPNGPVGRGQFADNEPDVDYFSAATGSTAAAQDVNSRGITPSGLAHSAPFHTDEHDGGSTNGTTGGLFADPAQDAAPDNADFGYQSPEPRSYQAEPFGAAPGGLASDGFKPFGESDPPEVSTTFDAVPDIGRAPDGEIPDFGPAPTVEMNAADAMPKGRRAARREREDAATADPMAEPSTQDQPNARPHDEDVDGEFDAFATPPPPAAALPSQGPPAESVAQLRSRLDELGVAESRYQIGTPGPAAWTIEQAGEGWRVGWYDKQFVAPAVFEDVADASAFLLGKILLDTPGAPRPAAARGPLDEYDDDDYDHRVRRPVLPTPTEDDLFQPAAELFKPGAEPAAPAPRPAAVATANFDDEDDFEQRRPEPRPAPRKTDSRRPQDWPIQPKPGEPPLTLFRGKQLMELVPGTEIDRYGEPTGNLTYAAGTPFERRSLVPDWVSRPYRAYRVLRPTEALSGVAIAWFDQPGGGTAYLLTASVTELLDSGHLVEVSDREPPTRP
nr:TNT domain-containing protein [Actinomycetota bacterium]